MNVRKIFTDQKWRQNIGSCAPHNRLCERYFSSARWGYYGDLWPWTIGALDLAIAVVMTMTAEQGANTV
jgi:hypothetical protein